MVFQQISHLSKLEHDNIENLKTILKFGAFSIFALFHNSCFCQKLTTIILSKDEILVKRCQLLCMRRQDDVHMGSTPSPPCGRHKWMAPKHPNQSDDS